MPICSEQLVKVWEIGEYFILNTLIFKQRKNLVITFIEVSLSLIFFTEWNCRRSLKGDMSFNWGNVNLINYLLCYVWFSKVFHFSRSTWSCCYSCTIRFLHRRIFSFSSFELSNNYDSMSIWKPWGWPIYFESFN